MRRRVDMEQLLAPMKARELQVLIAAATALLAVAPAPARLDYEYRDALAGVRQALGHVATTEAP